MLRKNLCLHVRGDDGDLHERSSSFSGDPVSKDFMSLLLWVNSSFKLFFTIIWLFCSDSESSLLGDIFDKVVSPVCVVMADALSQTTSSWLGWGWRVIVIVVALAWTASIVSVTVGSFIFITILSWGDLKLKLAQRIIRELHFQFEQLSFFPREKLLSPFRSKMLFNSHTKALFKLSSQRMKCFRI